MKRPGGFRTSTSNFLALLALVGGLTIAACGGSSTTAANTPSAATLPSASPSPSGILLPTPTVAGTIAFTRAVEPEVNYDIYVIRSDGTELKQLTDDPGVEEHPSWSPDGKGSSTT